LTIKISRIAFAIANRSSAIGYLSTLYHWYFNLVPL